MNVHALIGYPLFALAAVETTLGLFLLARGHRDRPSHRAVAFMALFSALYCLLTGAVYVRASLGLDYDLWYRMKSQHRRPIPPSRVAASSA